MKNNNNLRIIILGVISSACLCISCTHNRDNQLVEELDKLNKMMGEYLEFDKNFIWEIDDADYVDSIYNLGNVLINQIDNRQIDTSILNYLIHWSIHYETENIGKFFAIQSLFLDDVVYREIAKQKIRLLQASFLTERLQLILLSYFQCNGIGLYPINRKQWPEFKEGRTYNLDFFIQYTTPIGVPKPIVTINGDTLMNQKNSPIYTYAFRPTKRGKINLNREISVYKWLGMSEYDFFDSPIEVEVE